MRRDALVGSSAEILPFRLEELTATERKHAQENAGLRELRCVVDDNGDDCDEHDRVRADEKAHTKSERHVSQRDRRQPVTRLHRSTLVHQSRLRNRYDAAPVGWRRPLCEQGFPSRQNEREHNLEAVDEHERPGLPAEPEDTDERDKIREEDRQKGRRSGRAVRRAEGHRESTRMRHVMLR